MSLAMLAAGLNTGRPTQGRSPHWEGFEKKMVAGKSCIACGRTTNLQAHHKLPFHSHRELELDPNNIAILCEGDGRNCHYTFGHLYDWHSYNPNVEEDAEAFRNKRNNRPE